MGSIGQSPAVNWIGKPLLVALIAGFLLLFLVAGLWPFNYAPRNRVRLAPSGGVRFEGNGILTSRGPARPIPPSSFSLSGTIELLLKPDDETVWGTTHILTFTDASGYDRFYLGQWSDSLVLRWLDLDWSHAKNVYETGFSRILAGGRQRLVSLVFEPGRVSAFVDGSAVGSRPLPPSPWASSIGPLTGLVLGAAADGSGPWRGDILGLAVLARPIDPSEVRARHLSWVGGQRDSLLDAEGQMVLYAFEGDGERPLRNSAGASWALELDRRLVPPRRDFLLPPWRRFVLRELQPLDLAVNAIGFIPFGAALAVLFLGSGGGDKGRALLIPPLIGASVSLFVEINQAFLISRSSSLLDLGLNTLGTAAGALLARRLLPREQAAA